MKWSTLVACFACFSTEVEQCKTCIRHYCSEHMGRHLTKGCDGFGKNKDIKYAT